MITCTPNFNGRRNITKQEWQQYHRCCRIMARIVKEQMEKPEYKQAMQQAAQDIMITGNTAFHVTKDKLEHVTIKGL
jgi:hypothetical protein